AVEVLPHEGALAFGVDREEVAAEAAAGVVDERVDVAEPLAHGDGELGDLFGLAHIELLGERRAPGFFHLDGRRCQVLAVPHAHAPWEREAGISEIALVAEAADRLGYYHVTCSEHIAVPFSAGDMRGAAYWDPLSTFGYLAARTQQIKLVTHVLVLGYHHPLEIAKRYGTLDRVCNGRLILGVGVGTLQ